MICQEYPTSGKKAQRYLFKNYDRKQGRSKGHFFCGQDQHGSRSIIPLQNITAQVLKPCVTTLCKEH
eukprot:2098817-Prorocentrum_lima.AAC.1